MIQAKRHSNLLLIFGFVCFLIFSGEASGAEAPDAADPCFECHGDQGVNKDSEKDGIPTIAGASAFFLENQILIFQKEARPCVEKVFENTEEDLPADNHCDLAKDLSEEDPRALADYFASQEFVPADQSADPKLAKVGEKIHKQRCDKCHAEAGSLALDDAGILAGQWKPYLLEQLRNYKEGKRWQPEKMQPKMEELDEKDIEALAEYYISQGSKQF